MVNNNREKMGICNKNCNGLWELKKCFVSDLKESEQYKKCIADIFRVNIHNIIELMLYLKNNNDLIKNDKRYEQLYKLALLDIENISFFSNQILNVNNIKQLLNNTNNKNEYNSSNSSRRKNIRYYIFGVYNIYASDIVIENRETKLLNKPIMIEGKYNLLNVSLSGCFININIKNKFNINKGDKITFKITCDNKEIKIVGIIWHMSDFNDKSGLGIEFIFIDKEQSWQELINSIDKKYQY